MKYNTAIGENLIWNEVVPPRDSKKVEAVLSAFATDPLLQGEMLGLRLRDGKGRGCQVSGPMLGCEVTQHGEDTVADVRFAGDEWRVW